MNIDNLKDKAGQVGSAIKDAAGSMASKVTGSKPSQPQTMATSVADEMDPISASKRECIDDNESLRDVSVLPEWLYRLNLPTGATVTLDDWPDVAVRQQVLQFYRQWTKDVRDPLVAFPFIVSGTPAFSGILFFPHHDEFSAYDWSREGKNVKLYLAGKLATDVSYLLPAYMRFVKGIFWTSVPRSAFPSGASFDQSPALRGLSEAITAKCLQVMLQMTVDRDLYKKFHGAFAWHLREGLVHDAQHRNIIVQLLRFHSTRGQPDDLVGLDQYVARRSEQCKEIYIAIGHKSEELLALPLVRALLDKGFEVLLVTNPPFDKMSLDHIGAWKGLPLHFIP